MSDYRVKITIRNDRILSKIEEIGFPSVLKFCKHTGMQYGHTNDIISGKITPFYEVKGSGVCGELRKNVKRLLETLDMTIEEAFTEKQLKGFSKNSFETKVKEKELLKIVNPARNQETRAIESDINKEVNKVLFEYLNPRERYVIARRHGFLGEDKIPYSEIGLALRVSVERARQIEAKGLRKLRHPAVKNRLIETGFYDVFTSVDVNRRAIN